MKNFLQCFDSAKKERIFGLQERPRIQENKRVVGFLLYALKSFEACKSCKTLVSSHVPEIRSKMAWSEILRSKANDPHFGQKYFIKVDN